METDRWRVAVASCCKLTIQTHDNKQLSHDVRAIEGPDFSGCRPNPRHSLRVSPNAVNLR